MRACYNRWVSTKAGIIKCSIGVAVVLSLTLTADVLGYGYFVVLPLLIGGLALLGVGIVDTIVGITRARLGWIALMTLSAG